jgi:hypothetical protein
MSFPENIKITHESENGWYYATITWMLAGDEYGVKIKCDGTKQGFLTATEEALKPMLMDLVMLTAKETK